MALTPDTMSCDPVSHNTTCYVIDPDMDDLANITPARLKELRDCFRQFDRDDSGTITATEFQSALMNNGVYIEDSEVKRLIMEFDDDGSLTLDFEEFVSLIAQLDPKIGQDIELNKGFKLFDKDQDGFISRFEVKYALDRFGIACSSEDLDLLFKITDSNNDGLISLQEFRHMLYDPNKKADRSLVSPDEGRLGEGEGQEDPPQQEPEKTSASSTA